jgi:hypothetical protein
VSQVTNVLSICEEAVSKSNGVRGYAVVRWCAVLLALASAAVHVLTLASGPTPSSLHVVVVLGMAMGCLPCAMHLALLPRRRAWAQMAVVSAAMLGAHPLLSAVSGSGHHAAASGGAGLGAALVVGPVLGLALAVTGLVLVASPAAGAPAAGRPVSCARARAR